MSYVNLVVRERDRDWSGHMHGSSADRAIAALSADPVTLDELEAAVARFEQPVGGRKFFAGLRPGLDDRHYDAGLVVIDLCARLIASDSTYSFASREGSETFHNGQHATETPVGFHLADDWHIAEEGFDWRGRAERRRAERLARPDIDSRDVFYGQPLLEHIARSCFELARVGLPESPTRHDGRPMAEYEAIRTAHADWLMTPRDDLGGRSPRQVFFEGKGHVSRDLHDRMMFWTDFNRPAPPVSRESHAYRYAGFGTHELVVYYYLVRGLFWACWSDIAKPPTGDLESYLTAEIPRLAGFQEAWLDWANPEFSGHKARSIIDNERRRMPEGGDPHDHIVDADCPCCQMMAELPGVSFWGLDGCNMDGDFAFEIYRETREEWEAEQREYEEFSRQSDARRAEEERLGTDANRVWKSSFSADNLNEQPLHVRLFGIGGHLAELIEDLRPDADSQATIDGLNRAFGNLRDILQSEDANRTDALFDPVLDRFNDLLTEVANARLDLMPKCDSLRETLATFRGSDRPQFTDNDVPF